MNKEQQIIEFFEEKEQSDLIFRIDMRENWRFLLDIIEIGVCNSFNRYKLDLIFNYLYDFFSRIIKVENFLSLLKETLIKKNRDYGNSFDKSIKKFGWVYLAIELDKKKNRLHSLLKSKENPNYESIEDTLLDIAGYCVLALIYIENDKE